MPRSWMTDHDDAEAFDENSFDFTQGIVGLAQAAIADATINGESPHDALARFEDRLPDGVYAATGILLEAMRYSVN